MQIKSLVFFLCALVIALTGIHAVTAQDRGVSPVEKTPPYNPPITGNEFTAQIGAGDVQVTLSWNNLDDMDLWIYEPNGEVIYYGRRTSSTGGNLIRMHKQLVTVRQPPLRIFSGRRDKPHREPIPLQ